ncbi:hypothetical protein DFH29DRAFT_935987 [Suillus ampliporus]|nr:hypothetical protein DFH29DRAFT_935987 [Suillus ampliporus]
MSTTDSNHPVVLSPRTWFASWKAHPKNPSQNAADGSFSARTCYVLHGVLVLIHIVLVVFYISHWEHRVTLPFTPTNNDFWPVVLSASLQAFYTVYTAVLLFLTQRLAMSRTLVRRLKLTAIHDISGAWAGLGAALSSVWRQTYIPASWWMTSAVTAYLASISVLHVTSSTLLQFQTFNTSTVTSIPTVLGWRDGLETNIYDFNWEIIIAYIPAVNQLPGLVTAGLSNATVYDIPQTNSIFGLATVNTTTITSRCGLLPNITYSVDAGILQANSSIGNGNILSMGASLPWSDQIQVIPSRYQGRESTGPGSGVVLDPGVVLMVSTLLEIEPSVQDELAVPIIWESRVWGVASPVVKVYFVQCSLSAVTTEAVLDIQTNSLQNPVAISQPSTQSWEITNQWTSNDWQGVITYALPKSIGSGYNFFYPDGISEPSITDEYIMSLLGLNLTAEYYQYTSDHPPVSTFVLSPDKLGAAIAQVAAQCMWIASQIGISNGGFQLGDGMAYVNEDMLALRLNVGLSFAISASVIMMVSALCLTRAFHTSNDSQASIAHTGALQLMWLGHHSASVNEVLEDVEHPTETNLRRAGMIDVYFAKTIVDEDELGGSSDSLSGQNDDSRDDMMRY